MQTTIHEYFRDKYGRRNGMFVATVADLSNYNGLSSEEPQKLDKVRIGWAKCHSKKDKFDRNTGYTIAMNRIIANRKNRDIPHSMQDSLARFRDRASRYFKRQVEE